MEGPSIQPLNRCLRPPWGPAPDPVPVAWLEREQDPCQARHPCIRKGPVALAKRRARHCHCANRPLHRLANRGQFLTGLPGMKAPRRFGPRAVLSWPTSHGMRGLGSGPTAGPELGTDRPTRGNKSSQQSAPIAAYTAGEQLPLGSPRLGRPCRSPPRPDYPLLPGQVALTKTFHLVLFVPDLQ